MPSTDLSTHAPTLARFPPGSACVLHIFHSTYYTGYISY